MNIKEMGMEEPETRMIRVLPIGQGVVDNVLSQGMIAKVIGFEDIGLLDISYTEAIRKATGKTMFMKKNTDYVIAKIEEKGLGNNMITPLQNLEFYVSEPIGGGGGGGTPLASMGVDTPEDYFEIAEKMRAINILHWQEALEKGQVQTGDTPIMWFVVSVWDSVVHRDYE